MPIEQMSMINRPTYADMVAARALVSQHLPKTPLFNMVFNEFLES